MRFSLLLLATALLCAGSSLANRKSSNNNRRYSPFASDSSDNNDQMTAPAFQKNTEYSFVYNAQIAAGLIAQDEQSQADPQQKAITRIQCLAKITFGSQRHAQLCLRQIRAGQLNEPVKDEQQCQPMGIFEPKPIPEDKQHQLELCCQFDYAEGVIERVQFQQEDSTWSKNIKRGVLNMLQLNLNQNNAQGLRSGEDEQQQDDQDQEQQQENNNLQAQDMLASSFSIPEITVEGACQTTYTINTAKPSQRCSNPEGLPCSFNVTKAINFKQCSKIADVAFGHQTQQQQPQCAQCQMDWYKQQQKQQQLKQVFGLNGQQQANGEHPCAKCDPKEVKEQKVDRSTVLRYVLKCGNQQKQQQQEKNCANCCQLDRTELLSQYVYKNTKSENGPYGAAMHTVVCAQLQLRSVQQQREQVPTQSSDNDETLMFSNQWETDEKRFFMFGDEEYPDAKSSPFHQVPKASQAEQALRKLVQATQNKEQGIEPQQAVQLQRLVRMLRMCSQRDLKQVEQNIQQQHQSHQEQEKAKQIFWDALAICGTRNCVKKLAEKIQNQEFSPRKAALALNSLTNLPAPSDTIVEIVEHLCKSRQVQEQPALKQACWLTYGGLVNELCQHKTQKGAQQSVYGAQSGFNQQEQCPANKKEQYKQSILEQYEQAKSTYEKVLALSALGNAGIDSATPKLEQIIKDKREQRVVRVKAIDALRRLRTQQPQHIQQILLPIFQNTREQPEVRTAAFAILMYTQPEQTVMDQLAYSIGQEPNKQVQAFAYRTMKMLANSRSPVDQQISKHIKNALKLANVDEQQLRASGKWQIPMYSQQQQEGLFITLASTISSRSFLPAYAHAQIDSVLNEQFHINDVKLYAMQQEAEQWYEQTAAHFSSYASGSTRGQRRSSDSSEDYISNNGKSLRDIYTSLGIKSRRSYSAIDFEQSGKQQQPFAMFCLRTGDVDRAFIALDEETQSDAPGSAPIRELLQAVRSGQKPSLARMLASMLQQQQIQTTIATNLCEKQATIPTSVGFPLRMTSSVPVLATIEGTSKIEKQDGALKAQIKCQPMASIVHIQKMECWTPFLVTGVESIRSVEMNIPLHVQLEAGNNQQGLTLKVDLPREKIQLFGAHSLPFCYASEVDQKSGLVREPRHVRTIQNAKLQRMQHETNTVVGAQSMGIPLHIHSQYHWPGTPTSYQQYFQMLMATDNVVHVKYVPTEYSPSQAVFRLSGEHFQATTGQQLQLQDFYANKFEQADSEEQDYSNEFQTESHIQRRQKLQNFLGNFQPRQQYKHSLKISAQTTGGSKEFKGHCELAAHCDSKLQTCQVKIDAQRNQMSNEQQKWMLKAQAQLVMPETVSSVQEIGKLSEKNNKFACQAECQWGADQKQQINIRIQGEQVQRSAWRQLQLGGQQNGRQQQQQGQQQQQQRLQRRTAFLNKFDVEAQYTGLKPSTQNTFARCLELAKSAYFWNSNSQLVQQSNERGSQSNGKVLLSMTIDPITQKHANITVKTPSQLVRLQQIELPVQARPFPLVRQNAQSIQSIGQFISRQEVNSRAECTVDGRSVDTFDDQEYSSPLSTKCFSVLAKDCSGNNNEQPQFAVLMKAVSQQCNNKQSCPKKLKVITPEQTVECQQRSGSQQIQCKVNGQNVNVDDEDNTVQYNNGQQSDVTVHVRGISVRFNGRKAWLKVSSLYKNQQCGLCGHYDDQADEDEWRMSNNQIASDLGQFHRSYALQDGQECNQEELNSFYEQNGKNIRKRYQQNIDDEEDQDDQANNIQAQDWQSERFNGNFDSSDEDRINTNNMDDDDEEQYQYNDDEVSSKRCGKKNNKNCRRSQQIQPVHKTKVVEQNHEVCFSTQPVKQCPRGTVPAGRPTSEFDSSSSSSSQQDDDDQQDQEDDEQQWKQQKETNVPFVCMNRSSQEARQLLRQFRQGQKVLDVSDHGHSYVEKMRLPLRCRRV